MSSSQEQVGPPEQPKLVIEGTPPQSTKPFTFYWNQEPVNVPPGLQATKSVSWEAVLNEAKRLSGDSSCVYEGEPHHSFRYIIRRIRLPTRGELWVVKTPNLRLNLFGIPHTPCLDILLSRMSCEIATMKHVARLTDIRVPKVHGYHLGLGGNPVGHPYLFMECLEGNQLLDLKNQGIVPSEDQLAKLRDAFAVIRCKMSRLTVKQMGRLLLDHQGEPTIGQLPDGYGLAGPLDSPTEYYQSWSTCQLDISHFFPKSPDNPEGEFGFPRRLSEIIGSLLAVAEPNGPSGEYPITHTDLHGHHNVLVNDDFEVVGVISWGNAHAAPLEFFAGVTNDGLHLEISDEPDFVTPLRLLEHRAEIERAEDQAGIPRNLSNAMRSPLAEVAQAMDFHENGRQKGLRKVLERAAVKLGIPHSTETCSICKQYPGGCAVAAEQ